MNADKIAETEQPLICGKVVVPEKVRPPLPSDEIGPVKLMGNATGVTVLHSPNETPDSEVRGSQSAA